MGKPKFEMSARMAATLTDAWNSGATLDEIAARLGLSRSQVYRRRRQLGLPARKIGNSKLPQYKEVRIYVRADDEDRLRCRTNALGVTMSRYLRDMVLADLERSAG